MRKRKSCVIFAACVVAILFFPIASTQSFCGKAEILTEAGPRPGTCSLEIEIKELRSLVCCYRKRFSFTLDGTEVDAFQSNHFSQSEYGDCLVSQMYYDAEADRMGLCSLFCSGNGAFIELMWKDNRYILEPGG